MRPRHLVHRLKQRLRITGQSEAEQRLSLAQISDQRSVVEYSPCRAPLFACGGELPDGTCSLFRTVTTRTTPVFRYDFGPAGFDPALAMFGVRGMPLADVLYTQPEAVLRFFRDETSLPTEHYAGRLWAGYDHWHTNFYHWFAHTLPVVQLFLQKGRPEDQILLPQLTPWQQESLDLLGLPEENRLITQRGRRYLGEKIVYTDFLRGIADFTASETMVSMASRLRHKAGSAARPERLLYIERGAASNRKIPNEAALSERLQANGFEIVRPERLNVASQIRLFSEARMVVGFLGAGFTNIAWCQPGTIVCELVPSHHQNACFLPLAVRGQLRYWAELVQTGVTTEDHTSQATLPVDTDRILSVVSALLKET